MKLAKIANAASRGVASFLFCLFLIVGAGCAILGIGINTNIIIAAAGLFAAFLVAIAAHEIGHACAGILVGRRIYVLSVVPFLFRISPISFRISHRQNEEVFGFVFSTPKTPNQDTPTRNIAIFLCGPLASITLSAWLLLWAISVPQVREASFFGAFLSWCYATAFFSLAAASTTLIPFQTRTGRFNDAAKVFQAFRPRENDSTLALGYGIGLFFGYGISPRDWPNWIRENLRESEVKEELKFDCIQLQLIIATSLHDHVAAKAALEKLHHAGEPWNSIARVSDAYMTAKFEDNVEDAELLLAAAPDSIASGSPDFLALRHLARAAIASRTGDTRMMEQELQNVRLATQNRPYFPNPFWAELSKDLRVQSLY